MNTQPVVVEQWFAVEPDVVWRAITDPDSMRRWYFAPIEEFRAEVGFNTEFDIESGGRTFRHQWHVTEVVPGSGITYIWRFEGFSGVGSTEWVLTGIDGGTKLVLISNVIESFPQDIPEFTRESSQAGWEYLIQQSLPDFLNRT